MLSLQSYKVNDDVGAEQFEDTKQALLEQRAVLTREITITLRDVGHFEHEVERITSEVTQTGKAWRRRSIIVERQQVEKVRRRRKLRERHLHCRLFSWFKYDGGEVRDLASWPSLYKSVHQLLQSPPSSPSSQVDVEDIDEPGPSIQRPQQRQAAKKRTVARRGKGTSARRAAYKGKRPTTRTRRSKTPALRNNSGKVLAKQKEGMKKQVSKLTKPQLQAAITRAMEMEPGLMLLVLAAPAPGGNQPEGAGPQPEEGNIIPSWCVYGNCRDMPTQRERVCCLLPPESWSFSYCCKNLNKTKIQPSRIHMDNILALCQVGCSRTHILHGINRDDNFPPFSGFRLFLYSKL
ncbi:uncharacterized protein LOC128235797 [Mya arenaria]|uniref:uncharacterized protein LOC128235797 n=1 Tax=Mya arenaria TaxID=6604 RepID=UPI0022E59A5D|nr:uncharacterized protein LOC128235797 [Mya arenaria]